MVRSVGGPCLNRYRRGFFPDPYLVDEPRHIFTAFEADRATFFRGKPRIFLQHLWGWNKRILITDLGDHIALGLGEAQPCRVQPARQAEHRLLTHQVAVLCCNQR